MANLDFSRELIKGRIAEIIFEQMLREVGKFTILRFGYEYTAPQLAQYQRSLKEEAKKVIDNIRHTPDFILISEDKSEVYLVEVKYRSHRDKKEIKETAEEILKKWNHSWLFVASPDGFFFAPCNTIVRENGEIHEMWEATASKSLQKEYLELLNEFRLNGGLRRPRSSIG